MGALLLTAWNALITIGSGIISVLTVAGLLITVLDINQIRTEILSWVKRHIDWQKSIRLMNLADHFVADVIQIGGEFSRLYTLTVRVNQEGGYYLNPPSQFVSISFNRGGDLLLVFPSEFASKYGQFKIASYSTESGEVIPVRDGSFCGLRIQAMRNSYSVRFVRQSMNQYRWFR